MTMILVLNSDGDILETKALSENVYTLGTISKEGILFSRIWTEYKQLGVSLFQLGWKDEFNWIKVYNIPLPDEEINIQSSTSTFLLPDGSIIFYGSFNTGTENKRKAYGLIGKVDSLGNVRWVQKIKYQFSQFYSFSQYFHSTSTGEIFGSILRKKEDSPEELFLIKLDANGNLIQNRQMDSQVFTYPYRFMMIRIHPIFYVSTLQDSMPISKAVL